MNQHFYNEEERQYKDVIEVLKELPRIKAPDNFEYNLMTRITNNNFKTSSLRENQFTLFGFLKPGLAVAATAILIFFVVNYQQSDTENPFFSAPEKRTEFTDSRDAGMTSKEFVVSENPAFSEKSSLPGETAGKNSSSLRVFVHQNDVVAEENKSFPFPDNSFDLDTKMQNDRNPRSANDTRVLAGTGSERVMFEGFYTGTPFSRIVQDTSVKRDTLRIKKAD